MVHSYQKTKAAGYLDLPELAADEMPMKFGEFRALVPVDHELQERFADLPQEFRRVALRHADRKYWGFPSDVEPWFEKMWSRCVRPTDDEVAFFNDPSAADWRQEMRGTRLEALCYIESEGQRILRGMVASVPKQ